MARIEQRLASLGLPLPPPMQAAAGRGVAVSLGGGVRLASVGIRPRLTFPLVALPEAMEASANASIWNALCSALTHPRGRSCLSSKLAFRLSLSVRGLRPARAADPGAVPGRREMGSSPRSARHRMAGTGPVAGGTVVQPEDLAAVRIVIVQHASVRLCSVRMKVALPAWMAGLCPAFGVNHNHGVRGFRQRPHRLQTRLDAPPPDASAPHSAANASPGR